MAVKPDPLNQPYFYLRDFLKSRQVTGTLNQTAQRIITLFSFDEYSVNRAEVRQEIDGLTQKLLELGAASEEHARACIAIYFLNYSYEGNDLTTQAHQKASKLKLALLAKQLLLAVSDPELLQQIVVELLERSNLLASAAAQESKQAKADPLVVDLVRQLIRSVEPPEARANCFYSLSLLTRSPEDVRAVLDTLTKVGDQKTRDSLFLQTFDLCVQELIAKQRGALSLDEIKVGSRFADLAIEAISNLSTQDILSHQALSSMEGLSHHLMRVIETLPAVFKQGGEFFEALSSYVTKLFALAGTLCTSENAHHLEASLAKLFYVATQILEGVEPLDIRLKTAPYPIHLAMGRFVNESIAALPSTPTIIKVLLSLQAREMKSGNNLLVRALADKLSGSQHQVDLDSLTYVIDLCLQRKMYSEAVKLAEKLSQEPGNNNTDKQSEPSQNFNLRAYLAGIKNLLNYLLETSRQEEATVLLDWAYENLNKQSRYHERCSFWREIFSSYLDLVSLYTAKGLIPPSGLTQNWRRILTDVALEVQDGYLAQSDSNFEITRFVFARLDALNSRLKNLQANLASLEESVEGKRKFIYLTEEFLSLIDEYVLTARLAKSMKNSYLYWCYDEEYLPEAGTIEGAVKELRKIFLKSARRLDMYPLILCRFLNHCLDRRFDTMRNTEAYYLLLQLLNIDLEDFSKSSNIRSLDEAFRPWTALEMLTLIDLVVLKGLGDETAELQKNIDTFADFIGSFGEFFDSISLDELEKSRERPFLDTCYEDDLEANPLAKLGLDWASRKKN